MDDRPIWERDLDALVRPSLVVDPPADVQRMILAAVLQAAAAPAHVPIVAVAPIPVSAGARPVPLAAYLLLAAVLVAYVAAVSWLQGLFGGAGWLPTLLTQLLAVSELVVGRPTIGEPMSLAWLVLQRAPWIALLPLGWLLWERDRAAARAA
jgi:hypothetical protein